MKRASQTIAHHNPALPFSIRCHGVGQGCNVHTCHLYKCTRAISHRIITLLQNDCLFLYSLPKKLPYILLKHQPKMNHIRTALIRFWPTLHIHPSLNSLICIQAFLQSLCKTKNRPFARPPMLLASRSNSGAKNTMQFRSLPFHTSCLPAKTAFGQRNEGLCTCYNQAQCSHGLGKARAFFPTPAHPCPFSAHTTNPHPQLQPPATLHSLWTYASLPEGKGQHVFLTLLPKYYYTCHITTNLNPTHYTFNTKRHNTLVAHASLLPSQPPAPRTLSHSPLLNLSSVSLSVPPASAHPTRSAPTTAFVPTHPPLHALC